MYVNPYYTPIVANRPTSIAYDYSQPITINNYQAFDPAAGVPQVGDNEREALERFDQGLDAFRSGQYPQANQLFKESLRLNGGDPVAHEVYALSLFAVGDYEAAAATLNALLASAPGMDWTSLSSLYGNVGDYTTQLRRLEDYCDREPTKPAPAFVLAYHYLVLSEKEAAIDSLKVVVENQPNDLTAKRMLEALVPPDNEIAPVEVAPKEFDSNEITELPQIDLVGSWVAEKGDTTIELVIDEDASFTWIASSAGQQNAKLEGTVTTAPDGIVLETTSSGTLAGSVLPGENGEWTFYPPSAPIEDGLVFQRKK